MLDTDNDVVLQAAQQHRSLSQHSRWLSSAWALAPQPHVSPSHPARPGLLLHQLMATAAPHSCTCGTLRRLQTATSGMAAVPVLPAAAALHTSVCSVLPNSAYSDSAAACRLDEAIRLPLAAAATALAFVPQGGIVPPLLAVSCGGAGTQLWSQVLRCFVAAAVR